LRDQTGQTTEGRDAHLYKALRPFGVLWLRMGCFPTRFSTRGQGKNAKTRGVGGKEKGGSVGENASISKTRIARQQTRIKRVAHGQKLCRFAAEDCAHS